MAGITSADRQPARPARSAARRCAVGIYGTIITAGVLASAGDGLSTLDLALSVLITLMVYWVAEEYAEILGEHLAGGRQLDWRYALAATWPMLGASFLPLLLLVLARLAGAGRSAAANVALVAAVCELMVYAWAAGHAAQLRGRQHLAVTFAAAMLGLLMIILKDVVLVQLH
jgi:hypothetical protein